MTFPKRGQGVPPLIEGTAPQKVDLVDAAGVSFWFNGRDYGLLSPDATTLSRGARVDGATLVNSGFPVVHAPKRFTVSFPKTGALRYVCILHPGMAGTVRVVKRTPASDTVAEVATRRRRQLKADVPRANALVKASPPPRTVQVGRETTTGLSANAFFPRTLKVTAGTASRP